MPGLVVPFCGKFSGRFVLLTGGVAVTEKLQGLGVLIANYRVLWIYFDGSLKELKRLVALLENLRFDPGEEANDPSFSKHLASLADIYVNDAFGAAHRAHASTAGVADYLPAVAGLLMERELIMLGKAVSGASSPTIAIVGGAKVADKIQVLKNLATKVDTILVGGGMVAAFFCCAG